MDILSFFLQLFELIIIIARPINFQLIIDSKNQKQRQSSRTLFYCACAYELVVNNGNRGEIMEKLRGELWEGRAVDGKLKCSLEWPNN